MAKLMLTALEKIAMRSSTTVLAVSHSLVDECVARNLAPPESFVVLGAGSSNGVRIDTHRPALGAAERTSLRFQFGLDDIPTLGYVGRITPDKGVHTLISAVERIAQAQELQLLLVGEIEDKSYLAGALGSGGGSSAVVVHRSGVSDPSELYRTMDVFCLPSLREGFPNVILEASASGLPVITTTATGCRDAVVEGETGWLVPPNDVSALVAAIQNALVDPVRSAAIGMKGRSWVAQRFERRHVWAQLDEFLKSQQYSTVQKASGRNSHK